MQQAFGAIKERKLSVELPGVHSSTSLSVPATLLGLAGGFWGSSSCGLLGCGGSIVSVPNWYLCVFVIGVDTSLVISILHSRFSRLF